MPESWIKLQTDILNSSIMIGDPHVPWLFVVTLLLAREQDWEGGTFKAHPRALAARSGLDLSLVEDALEILAAPDPDTTTPDHGGRRLIKEGPNRWRVVNWEKYQDSPLRAKWREDKRRQRAGGHKVDTSGQLVDTGGQSVDLPSVSVSVSDSKLSKKKKAGKKVEYTPEFEGIWERSWRRGHKKAAFSSWGALGEDEVKKVEEVIGEWTKVYERRDGEKRPHVSTWLNNAGWEGDLAAELAKGRGSQQRVGEHRPPEADEGRVRKVRAAIVEFRAHLLELNVPMECAEVVGKAIEDLKALADRGVRDVNSRELVEEFQQINDQMLLALASETMTAEERGEVFRKAHAGHTTDEAAVRASNAILRKTMRERLGIQNITDYDWEG